MEPLVQQTIGVLHHADLRLLEPPHRPAAGGPELVLIFDPHWKRVHSHKLMGFYMEVLINTRRYTLVYGGYDVQKRKPLVVNFEKYMSVAKIV